MEYLSLYTEPQISEVEKVSPMAVDHGCLLCPLSESCKTPCMSPEGSDEKGGLLIVADHPFRADDTRGRPFSSTLGAKLRKTIRAHWDGPVYLDYAVKCAPKRGKKVTDTIIATCRGYLGKTIEECQPSKIILLGSLAMKSMFGRSAGPFSTRKCFGWLEKTNTPVFMLMSNQIAFNNRFLERWFEEDLSWAIKQKVPDLREQSSRDGIANMITTAEEAKDAASVLRDSEWISYDSETVGLLFNDDFEIISVAVASKYGEDAFVWSGNALADEKIVDPLLRLLEDPNVKTVAQNAKYDSNAMYSAFGIEVQGLHLDTRLIRKLLEPESVAKLSVLQEAVGMGGGKEIADKQISSITRKIRKATSDIELAEVGPIGWVKPISEKVCSPGVYAYGLMDHVVRDRYCARDTVSTARIAELYEQRLEGTSIQVVWDEIMLPAARAIEYVERWGVAVDKTQISSFASTVTEMKETVTSKLFDKGEFNLNSTRELCNMLYTVYKLPILSKTDTGNPSTDKATLELLRTKNLSSEQKDFVEAMLEYRKVSKMHSTYATKLGGFIRGDGRVHPSFNLVGARSGRISCSDPNVQQIPRADTELSSMARNCFVAPKGRVFVQLDYSQLELRIAAVLSNDKNMGDVFRSGEDYHMRTAQLISKQAWGISPDEVTKTHRTAAKSVNFGLFCGMSTGTLAKNIGCSKDEAERIQNAVFGSFPDLKRWCDNHVQMARREGCAYTYWKNKRARVRPLFRIADQDDHVRKTAENGSFNTPVQGTASDFCLASLARCVEWLVKDKFPAKLVLTVHDSLLFEVDEKHRDELINTATQLMTDWESNNVPLVVDAEIGETWGTLESF